MKFMMQWSIKHGCAEKAIDRFLGTGAPMPEGLQQLGRYHAPGSDHGWIVVETSDPSSIYVHCSEWGELLNWKVEPVIEDADAGAACKKAWSK